MSWAAQTGRPAKMATEIRDKKRSVCESSLEKGSMIRLCNVLPGNRLAQFKWEAKDLRTILSQKAT